MGCPFASEQLLEFQVNILKMSKFSHENSKSKKGHNFVKKNWRITSPTGMGSPFDSEKLL